MGKCGSKQSKSSVKSNNDDQYDFASVVDKFNEYSEEAEHYVGQGEPTKPVSKYLNVSIVTQYNVQNCN